jgi:hypothetical protein
MGDHSKKVLRDIAEREQLERDRDKLAAGDGSVGLFKYPESVREMCQVIALIERHRDKAQACAVDAAP